MNEKNRAGKKNGEGNVKMVGVEVNEQTFEKKCHITHMCTRK